MMGWDPLLVLQVDRVDVGEDRSELALMERARKKEQESRSPEERTYGQISMMNPIITQPGIITTQVVSTAPGTRWSSGMCDCCDDCGICCCALWCFPCMQCRTVSEFGECLCLPLLEIMNIGCMGFNWTCPPITIALRSATRERYKIKGSICDDCVRSCFCYSCTWCQIAREIKKREGRSTVTTAHTTIISNAPIYPHVDMSSPLLQE
ncbi:cornifelin homolog [Rhinophrynus dorsalis]